MIKSANFTNFKSLSKLRVDFKPLTVFVGANASGKTSILDAIHFMVAYESDRSLKKPFDHEQLGWLYTRGATGAIALSLRTASGTFQLNATPSKVLQSDPQEPLVEGKWKHATKYQPDDNRAGIMGHLKSSTFLRLDAHRLAEDSYLAQEVPELASDGEGLASVLAYTKLTDDDAFAEIENSMRALISQLRRILRSRRNWATAFWSMRSIGLNLSCLKASGSGLAGFTKRPSSGPLSLSWRETPGFGLMDISTGLRGSPTPS